MAREDNIARIRGFRTELLQKPAHRAFSISLASEGLLSLFDS
jgi:hypothetical protein